MQHQKKKIGKPLAVILVVCTVTITTLLILPQPTTAKFIVASWDYPDQYGQGIDTVTIYGNSTGSWVLIDTYDYDDPAKIIDWNQNDSIKLKVWCWLNSTLVGASTTNEGKLFQRHSVTVGSNNWPYPVFSQQNFTYSNVYTEAAPMWYYVYEVVLDFQVLYATTYTVSITYEVFY